MATLLSTTTGKRVRNPEPVDIEKFVAAMPRDSGVVVEDDQRPGHYAQAWLTPAGVHQVEFRDGSPERHYRSFTSKPDAVVAFLTDWLAGAVPDPSTGGWEDIAALFTAGASDNTNGPDDEKGPAA